MIGKCSRTHVTMVLVMRVRGGMHAPRHLQVGKKKKTLCLGARALD